jgi:hypothetical protein
VEKNWGLYELVPQRASLEDIFVQLTTEDIGTQRAGKAEAHA